MVGREEPDSKLAREVGIKKLSSILNNSETLSLPTDMYRPDLREGLSSTALTMYLRPSDKENVPKLFTKFTSSKGQQRNATFFFLR